MDKLREAQAFFGEKAEAYRKSPSHANAQELAGMLDLLQPAPGARALDVATGGGHTAVALARAGCRVVATDATPPMLAAAVRGAGEEGVPLAGLVTADAQRMPLRDGAFDIVASRIAPHHFPDLPRFVREARRVLRPGGALYVFDLTSPEDARKAAVVNRIETLRDPSHVWSHAPSTWRGALDAAGLAVERLATAASEFDVEPWIARARMTPTAEAELRGILREARDLDGYGLRSPGRMQVLRVEILARAPA